jgi:hypothetical protein
MKSLLFQGVTPFEEPPKCAVVPCRSEVPITIRKDGRLYRFMLRDKVVPEDPYLVLVKAIAFAISENEPFSGQVPDRSVRDFLIKDTVVI